MENPQEGFKVGEDATSALRQRVGANLRALREMRGLSLADVSAAVEGVKPDTLSNWENGKTGVSYEKAWALADFYGVSLEALRGTIAYRQATGN